MVLIPEQHFVSGPEIEPVHNRGVGCAGVADDGDFVCVGPQVAGEGGARVFSQLTELPAVVGRRVSIDISGEFEDPLLHRDGRGTQVGRVHEDQPLTEGERALDQPPEVLFGLLRWAQSHGRSAETIHSMAGFRGKEIGGKRAG